jgi:hypothetical protein
MCWFNKKKNIPIDRLDQVKNKILDKIIDEYNNKNLLFETILIRKGDYPEIISKSKYKNYKIKLYYYTAGSYTELEIYEEKEYSIDMRFREDYRLDRIGKELYLKFDGDLRLKKAIRLENDFDIILVE